MKQYVYVIFFSMATLACGGAAAPQQQKTAPVAVQLKIPAEAQPAVSGYPVPADISMANRSNLPFCYIDSHPETFIGDVVRFGDHSRVSVTAETEQNSTLMSRSRRVYPARVVPPGEYATFGGGYHLAEHYDFTLPGKYRVRLAARDAFYHITKPAKYLTAKGVQKVGERLYLAVPNDKFSNGYTNLNGAHRIGKLKSNMLILTVLPPYQKLPADALVESKASDKSLPAIPHGNIKISIRKIPEHDKLPVLLSISLQAGKGAAKKIHLTGNPLVDFQPTQAEGPDGIKGDELVKKPKPHYIPIPNRTPVPLTAYGKQLAAREPSKKLEWETYTLKPNKVYKYAVPVNLGCRFDMSIPGTYHVRLKLAHTNIHSAWTDIHVPHTPAYQKMLLHTPLGKILQQHYDQRGKKKGSKPN